MKPKEYLVERTVFKKEYFFVIATSKDDAIEKIDDTMPIKPFQMIDPICVKYEAKTSKIQGANNIIPKLNFQTGLYHLPDIIFFCKNCHSRFEMTTADGGCPECFAYSDNVLIQYK